MRAIVIREGRAFCETVPDPELREPSDVRIRVSCAAICRTDVFVVRGRIPVADGLIPGHEFTGVVDSVGAAVSRVKPGDRVVVNPLIACGLCEGCRDGRSHLCGDAHFLGIDRDGAFAELVVVPEHLVHRLPGDVSDPVGAYAEPLAATLAVLDANLPTGKGIAVTGRWRIAELTTFLLVQAGYDVTNGGDSPGPFAAVVETDLETANADATIRLLAPGGLLVVKSRLPEPVSVPRLLCIRRGVRLQFVHYAPFELALEGLSRWAGWLEQYVGGTWPLEEHERAFADACGDEAAKVYFRPGG